MRSKKSSHGFTDLSVSIREIRGCTSINEESRLRRLLRLGSLSYTFADLERQLARLLVHVDDDVVSVQDLSVQNLHGERILHQLLDRPFQRPRSESGIIA